MLPKKSLLSAQRSKMDGFRWLGGLLFLVGLSIGCQHSPTLLEAGVEMRPEGSELDLFLRASKAVYAMGEPLELTLEVVNRSPRPVTLEFRTAQRYDVLIRNAQGQEVWRWGADRVFAQLLGQETLPPMGGKLTYAVVASAPLPQGSYTVIAIVPTVDAQMSARLELIIA